MVRRLIADFLLPILAIIGGGLFELIGLRLPWDQLLYSRLINGSTDLFGGLAFNKSRAAIIAYCERKNWRYKKFSSKQIGETITFALIQAPFYALSLWVIGVTGWKIALGFFSYTIVAPIGGPFYGFIIDKSYRLLRIPTIQSNP